jgi:hypothetical protein
MRNQYNEVYDVLLQRLTGLTVPVSDFIYFYLLKNKIQSDLVISTVCGTVVNAQLNQPKYLSNRFVYESYPGKSAR